MPDLKTKKRFWSGWYTALLIVAGLIFAIAELPENYSNDLSVIGKGQKVIASSFTTAKNSPASIS